MASTRMMEPPCRGRQRRRMAPCELWAPAQSSLCDAHRRGIEALGLQTRISRRFTVNVTLLGGGFGRKSKCRLRHRGGPAVARRSARPVKVQWTREDDIRHGF